MEHAIILLFSIVKIELFVLQRRKKEEKNKKWIKIAWKTAFDGSSNRRLGYCFYVIELKWWKIDFFLPNYSDDFIASTLSSFELIFFRFVRYTCVCVHCANAVHWLVNVQRQQMTSIAKTYKTYHCEPNEIWLRLSGNKTRGTQ